MIPKNEGQLVRRLNQAKQHHKKRDALIKLCREIYYQNRARSTEFLGSTADWRSSIPDEYYESSPKGTNAINVATAVLSGHYPQFKVTTSIAGNDPLKARAEKFLQGVIRLNSRRSGQVLHQYLAFRTILDGGVGVRTTWDPSIQPANVEIVMDRETGEENVVAHYNREECPIILEIIELDKLLPMGKGPRGAPYREIFHIDSRTGVDVIEEWQDNEGVNLAFIEKLGDQEKFEKQKEYVEWWSYEKDGIYYAVLFDKKYVVPPRIIEYPQIPYTLIKFQDTHRGDKDSWKESLPFLYPILWAVERTEFLSTRIVRTLDMLANLPPVHRGSTPIQASGLWGQMLELTDPQERIEFPTYPGTPPDLSKYLDALGTRMSEGTFSEAMYGQVSSRLSGYGLSQLIGADTLRMDLPRGSLELGLSSVADQVFGLLELFAMEVRITVVAQARNQTLTAALSGRETMELTVDAFVKPKQPADEVRLATLGAQLAAMPNPPVSLYYILEHFFGIAQPEEEISTKMAEDAQKDPIVRLLALQQVLADNQSPYVTLIQAQLQQAMGAAGAPPGGPETSEGMGLGMQQAVMGNAPNPQPGFSPVEETGPTQETMRLGGPMG